MVPILLDLAKQKLEKSQKKSPRLGAIWVTPIRALAKEILQSGERAIAGMDLNLTIEIRTGDTTAKDKLRIKKSPPDVLITTPESLHVLLTQAHYDIYFGSLSTVVVDEWHDLIGSKRGVQMELVLSKFKALSPSLKIWGISATIGNLEEAMEVLLGDWFTTRPTSMIRSNIKKKYEVESIFPDDLDELPWAGHLGIKLFEKVIPILLSSESTLIFLNTRGQAEIWYQKTA